MSTGTPFTCLKCGHKEAEFHNICPECVRPFMRDYTDTQIHPRDPDLTGICTVRFWARVLLVLTVGVIVLGILSSFGLL